MARGSAAPAPAPLPWLSVWTAVPPLIGAGLVRLHAQPTTQEREHEMKTDIYERVTDKIIADLEQGELTWLKPWSAGNMEGKITKPLRHNGVPYSGINILMLWGASIEAGYLSPYWMTFKQAKELGAHVRKGERGNLVVYANTITKTEEQDDGSRGRALDTLYEGLHRVQCRADRRACPSIYYAKPEPVIAPDPERSHSACRRPSWRATGADIRHGGNSAHYSGGSDHVQMPVL